MDAKFGPLEHFFAKKMLGTAFTEEKAHFLMRLMKSARQGSLCLKAEEEMTFPPSIVGPPDDMPQTPIVRYKDHYYLQKNWVYETVILKNIQRLQGLQPVSCEPFASQEKLLPEQAAAVRAALANVFSIICGGPGTGKTYTAATLIRYYLASAKKRVCLAAPTGKASSHLLAVVGASPLVEATTLHRLLRLQPGENRLGNGRKIDAGLVLVDEASMIDVPMLAHLLEAVGEETRLVLMGDPDQLPPIEGGTLFSELATQFGTFLKRSMRTDDSTLQTIAFAIQAGEKERAQELIKANHQLDWKFDGDVPKKLYERVRPLISWERPDPNVCLEELARFRVLCALRQGPFGVDELNRQIVQEMTKRIRPGQWWAVPILITSNEPRLELYNGTYGILIGQGKVGHGVGYFADGRSFRALPSYEIAFCLSVHKSQGSEFDHVLALFPVGSENFGKEALYTAVTRAKKKLEIMTDDGVLPSMISPRPDKPLCFLERLKTLS